MSQAPAMPSLRSRIAIQQLFILAIANSEPTPFSVVSETLAAISIQISKVTRAWFNQRIVVPREMILGELEELRESVLDVFTNSLEPQAGDSSEGA